MAIMGNIVQRARVISPRANRDTPGEITTSTLPKDFLTRQIDLQDRIPEAARVGKPGYMHVSSLIGGCSREHVIASRTGTSLVNYVTGADRVVWAMGRASEAHVRKQLLAASGKRGIYGKWTCEAHHEVERAGFFDHTAKCHCGQTLERYAEITLLDHDNRVCGNPDKVLRVASAFMPVEMKSMEGDAWDALEAPLGNHVHQAIMYRYLLQKNGFAVHDKVIVFYVKKRYAFPKKGQKGHPVYKEFHIDATTPQMQQIVADTLAIAKDIADHLTNQTTPERICDSPTCSRAKYQCKVPTTCFAL